MVSRNSQIIDRSAVVPRPHLQIARVRVPEVPPRDSPGNRPAISSDFRINQPVSSASGQSLFRRFKLEEWSPIESLAGAIGQEIVSRKALHFG